MIWQIVKKQLLLFWRNRTHFLLLLGLPLLLILILGTALSGVMDQESPKIEVKIAILELSDEEEQIERFIDEITANEPKEKAMQLESRVVHHTPIQILKENVFGNVALKDMIEVDYIPAGAKEDILKDSSYTALVEIPDDFTYQFLRKIFLAENVTPSLTVYGNESSSIGFNLVQSLLERYQAEYTIGILLANYHVDGAAVKIDANKVKGEHVTINEKEPITTKGYYTVAMAVMHVLFIASTISFYTFQEKKDHVFNRIIMANVSSWTYFTAIFISSVILAFIQLSIIFGFSALFYNVTWPNLTNFIILTLFVCIAISGITVLLTAINYRLNSEVITTIFSSIIIYIMALLGGSFFPIGDFSKTIQQLGNYTPNGAALTLYLSILRGEELSEIVNYLYFLGIFSIVLLIIAVICFPKRGHKA